MIIRITSWNTFGSCISKISSVSGKLISSKRRDILLIQEAGATDNECNELIGSKDITLGNKRFKCFFQDDENAQNKRCTTGILVEEGLWSEATVKFDSLTLSGVRRPVVFCTLQPKGYPPLYIATIHATAYSRISVEEINLINDKFRAIARQVGWQWILMGDFNAEPNLLQKKGIPIANMVYPMENTHINIDDSSKNKILDYAIVSDGLKGNLNAYCLGYFGISDHIPVYLELEV